MREDHRVEELRVELLQQHGDRRLQVRDLDARVADLGDLGEVVDGAQDMTGYAFFNKKPTMLGMITGAVAGLAAVTPASGFVGVKAAMLIGVGAAVSVMTQLTIVT